ncbi:methyltransferase domain-containing protein [Agrobacterium vitis]|uniref:methyltransferase domain-containing protein n=1 Tax=Agrobacterium vitis TaxID=373 RepID=UPI0012E7B75C|nr:methyltransferase domain-containing protein [Agrobacterium vitis]MVA27892.1 methyltransferase type 11 [Agrobacterium vitis]
MANNKILDGILSKFAYEKRDVPNNKSVVFEKSVDRLSVLDGVVVATGWSNGAPPIIMIGDNKLTNQLSSRHGRFDLSDRLGDDAESAGFRVCGFLGEAAVDYSSIYLKFKDGTTFRRTINNPEDRINELFSNFISQVGSASDASLIEIGSRARSGNSYKSLFPSVSDYTGIDITSGPNVDIVADAHKLSQAVNRQYDFAFSISVFEHLIMPWVAAYELSKVLKIGGMAYIQSHASWPLHELPWDFFRFSKESWKGIFNHYTGFTVLDEAYGLEASIVPSNASGGPMQAIELQQTYLLSGCLVEKISEPTVDWSCDPNSVFNMAYSHGTQ